MFRKISIKFTIIFLLISLAPLALISFVSIKTARNTLKESIMENFKNLAVEKAEAITHILQEKMADAKYLASTHELIGALRQANSAYSDKTQKETQREINRMDEEWIANKGVTPTAIRLLENDLSRFLENYQKQLHKEAGELFLTDAKGVTVAMTQTLSDYYQADEMWWEKSFNEGRGAIFFDDMGYDESMRDISIGVVAPVRDGGEVTGILKINFHVKGILDIVARTKIGETDLVFLGRTTGGIVAMSKERDYGLTELEKGLVNKEYPGITEDLHDNIKTIMAYAPVRIPLNTKVPTYGARSGISGEKWKPAQWMLFIEIDQKEAFDSLRKLENIIKGIGGIIFLAVLLLALYLAKSVTTPIKELITSARIIGKGDLDRRATIRAKDEIGDLATAFNKMAGDLKSITASRDELTYEITQREQAEERLKRSEEKFRGLVESTNDWVWEVDENFVYTYASPKVCDIIGYEPEEIIGKTPFDLMPPEEAMHIRDVFTPIAAARKPFSALENINLHKDGRLVVLETSGIPFFGKDGKFLGYRGMDRDITEQQKVQARIEEWKNRYEAAVMATQHLLYDWDSRTNEVIYGGDTRKILGYSIEEMGRNLEDWSKLVHPKDRNYFNETVDHLIKTKKPAHLEYRVRKKGGNYIFVEDSGHFFLDSDGKMIRMVGFIKDVTQRKQAEEEKNRITRLNQLILDSAGEGIYGLDLNGNTTFINPAAGRMVGWEVEDLIGKSQHDVLHHSYPDGTSYPKEKCPIYSAFKDGNVHHVDNEVFWRKDGTSFWVEYVSTPIRNEQGELIGAVVIFRDISERKRVEIALRERYKELNCLYSISLLERKADLSIEELLQKTADLLPPSWLYPEIAHGRVTLDGKEYSTQGFMESPWKQTADVIVNDEKIGMVQVFYEKETAHEYEGPFLKEERALINDIAKRLSETIEHKLADEALSEKQGQLNTITSSVQDAIIMINEEGKVTYWNQAAEKIFGFSGEETRGRKLHEIIIPARYKGAHLEGFQSFQETGKGKAIGKTVELAGLRKNGEEFPLELSLSSIKIKGSWHAVGTIRDITKRKKAEEKERIHREQLAHKDRMSSLGIMASGIGHEINNPNNFVMMNIMLIQEMWRDINQFVREGEQALGEKEIGGLPFQEAMRTIPQLIADILEGSSRIEKIVTGMRDFALMEKSRYDEEVKIGKIISSSEILIKGLLKKSTKNFRINLGQIPPVNGNFQKLEQVMVNLLTNACHSLTDPDQAIEISAFHDKARGLVIIKVLDEGKGMEPETLRRVNEPFFTTKHDSGGTGLGGAISFEIIKDHGGVIEYSSEPGKGTTVTIILPEA